MLICTWSELWTRFSAHMACTVGRTGGTAPERVQEQCRISIARSVAVTLIAL